MISSLSTRAAPGDAVLFNGARCGLIATAFEEAFTNRPDVGRAQTAAATGALDNLPADPALLQQRLNHASRVWHIDCTHLSGGARQAAARTAAAQQQALTRAGFAPVYHQRARGVDIIIEQRPTNRQPAAAPAH
ncbi:hypothetical protein [Streptomyces sp. Ac-502]|uniref:hypothetical protein n=1 Tax=Streptomyces sp. Ac-502 TaxID=3342801 RepID=UPI00386280F5